MNNTKITTIIVSYFCPESRGVYTWHEILDYWQNLEISLLARLAQNLAFLASFWQAFSSKNQYIILTKNQLYHSYCTFPEFSSYNYPKIVAICHILSLYINYCWYIANTLQLFHSSIADYLISNE